MQEITVVLICYYLLIELTGNPLECPFSPIKAQKVQVEINKPEDSHIPLNLLHAR